MPDREPTVLNPFVEEVAEMVIYFWNDSTGRNIQEFCDIFINRMKLVMCWGILLRLLSWFRRRQLKFFSRSNKRVVDAGNVAEKYTRMLQTATK